jgi:hypothetical protein
MYEAERRLANILPPDSGSLELGSNLAEPTERRIADIVDARDVVCEEYLSQWMGWGSTYGYGGHAAKLV